MKKGPIKTVLAITDFSKCSTNTVLFAANLLKYSNLKIILLNTFETPNDKASLLISVEDILSKDSEYGLKKQSDTIASVTERQKLSITTHSQSGKLNKVIGKELQKQEVDLIADGIESDKYPSMYFNNIPTLFMGQSRYPVLLVPETTSIKNIKSILVLNLDKNKNKNHAKEGLEKIINHNHLLQYSLNIFENKFSSTIADSINKLITRQKVDLIIIIPSPGDKIDRALLNYQFHELCPSIVSLLKQ
jgi:Universal stress protein family